MLQYCKRAYHIPPILHSRCELNGYGSFIIKPDGNANLYMSKDTFPELFEMQNPEIFVKAPKGWKPTTKGYQKYLWFPKGKISDTEKVTIFNWIERFKKYVIIGINEHLENDFSDQLDYCMALEFRAKTDGENTGITCTETGQLVASLKEGFADEDNQTKLELLIAKLHRAFHDLPLQNADAQIILSTIPANDDKKRLPQVLTERLAKNLPIDYDIPVLKKEKLAIKSISLEEKIGVWKQIYDDDKDIESTKDVAGKLVVVIDDLYQSGVTLWSYARYLKRRGAKYVIGLVCVKNMRDTDNQ